MDFDGVHTDNYVTVFQDGREAVRVSRSDGMGVSLLQNTPLRLLILSTEANEVVSARARKLKVDCLQGVQDKSAALKEWLSNRNLDFGQVIFLGNDVNDVELLALCGLPVVVRDCHRSALAVSVLRLRKPGGHGAVRELADLILKCRNHLSMCGQLSLRAQLILRLTGSKL